MHCTLSAVVVVCEQAQPELMPFIAAALDPGQPASLHKVCIKGKQQLYLGIMITLPTV
jgi:hypothetical protein